MTDQPISVVDAVKYIEDNPGLDIGQIRDLVSRLEFDIPLNTKATVLYSGPVGQYNSGAIANGLAAGSDDIAIIDRTAFNTFLNNPVVQEAVLDAFGGIQADANAALFGSNGGLWSEASARFASAARGAIITITPDANPEKIFGSVEIENILNNADVTTINGVPKSLFIERYNSIVATEGVEAASADIFNKINTLSAQNLSNLSIGTAANDVDPSTPKPTWVEASTDFFRANGVTDIDGFDTSAGRQVVGAQNALGGEWFEANEAKLAATAEWLEGARTVGKYLGPIGILLGASLAGVQIKAAIDSGDNASAVRIATRFTAGLATGFAASEAAALVASPLLAGGLAGGVVYGLIVVGAGIAGGIGGEKVVDWITHGGSGTFYGSDGNGIFVDVYQRGADGKLYVSRVRQNVDASEIVFGQPTSPNPDFEIVVTANRDGSTRAAYVVYNEHGAQLALDPELLHDFENAFRDFIDRHGDLNGISWSGYGYNSSDVSAGASTNLPNIGIQQNTDGTITINNQPVRVIAVDPRNPRAVIIAAHDSVDLEGNQVSVDLYFDGSSLVPTGVRRVQNGGVEVITDPSHPGHTGHPTAIRIPAEGRTIDFVDAADVIATTFGRYLIDGNIITQTLTSAALKTVASNLGDILNAEVFGHGFATAKDFENVFGEIEQEFALNLQSAGIGAISAFLTAQLINDLGLGGLGGQAANSLANYELTTIITNIANIAESSTGAGNVFEGITDLDNLGNVAGAFIGNTLANEIGSWDEIGEQIGSSIGGTLGAIALSGTAGSAAISSIIGQTVIPVPIIGAIIGSLLGNLIGGLIGGIFTGVPKSGAIVGYDEGTDKFLVTDVWKKDGGKKAVARAMGNAAADTLNQIVSKIGGELTNGSAIDAGSYGMRGKKYVYWEDGTSSDHRITFSDSGNLVEFGVMKAVKGFKFLGGDVYAKRAFYATLTAGYLDHDTNDGIVDPNDIQDGSTVKHVDFGLNTLLGNLAVADRLETYLAASASINALIAAEPNSAFAADWLLALTRATDLGLLKRNVHDWDGGFSYLIGAAGVDARDVQFRFNALGNQGNGERVTFLGSSEMEDTIDSQSKTIISGAAGDEILTASHGGTRSDSIDLTSSLHIANVFYGGDGDDQIYAGDTGDDLFGDAGNDILVGGALDDWLLGGDGDDVLDAGGGNGNVLSGGNGNDRLLGADKPSGATLEDGSDWLSGGAGDDIINARGGNDYISGNQGNDVIDGGAGNDTIIFRAGDGHDQLSDSGTSTTEHDVLDFGAGIAPSDVTVVVHSAGIDLSLLVNGPASGDRIDLRGAVTNVAEGIEEVSFTSGSWGKSDLAAHAIYAKNAGSNLQGTSTDETLAGTVYDDMLSGGGGHDILSGGDGSDTYIFNPGDGDVTIDDVGSAVDVDAVQFGAGITLADISISYDPANPHDIILTIGSNGDKLTLKHQDVSDGSRSIEELRFADGTSLTLRDLYRLGTGPSFNGTVKDAATVVWDQTLGGGDGPDSFSYNAGDGNVRINESYWSYNDTLVLGVGIRPEDLIVTRNSQDTQDVWIRFKGQTGSILLNDQDSGGGTGIEHIQFADGTTWDRTVLSQKIVDREGTAGAEVIYDGQSGTVISAGAGDDIVYAGSGADTIIGGQGDDDLYGGDGGNTYVYNIGDGNDRIVQGYWEDGVDTLSFGAGIAPGDLVLTRDATNGSNVRIGFTDHPGSILLQGQSDGRATGIEQIQFADGTIWDRAALDAQVVAQAVSAANDIVRDGYYGLAIDAGAGNDVVYAGSGADIITGGTGDDDLYGGDGGNTYVYNIGDGNDRITQGFWEDGVDTLSFGAGITPGDLVLTREASNGSNVRISFTDHSGSILLQGQSDGRATGIEQIQFADGTIWDRAALDAQVVAQAVSAANDIVRDGYYGLAIDAGAGNDVVYAGSGADTITGGTGDDDLYGGDGGNTYIYNIGDGNDRIVQGFWEDGVDTLSFGAGIAPTDLILTRDVLDTNNVTISFASGAGSILLEDQFGGRASGIEQIQFADGTIWDRGAIEAHISVRAPDITGSSGSNDLTGTAGQDQIYGYGGDDTLTGGTGNDFLAGGGDDDTYVFNRGDGADTIYDDWGSDTLRFGAGITVADLVLLPATTDGDVLGLFIGIAGTSDRVYIRNQNANNGHGIEHFEFADGTVLSDADMRARLLTGTAGDDRIYGTPFADQAMGGAGNDEINTGDSNDTLTGGTGDDYLNGQGGDDTYVFNRGDGSDTIFDDWGTDTLRFGAGISAADLVLTIPTVDNDFQGLIVSIVGTSDRIYLRNQNSANGHGVERFEFADGTVLTDANLRTMLMSAIVTNGNDKVYGTNYADTINGGLGDDEITSGDGNDTLTGGQGNDYLNGQGGDDTYVFNRGDGSDTIFDDWGTDTLRFGAGISAADLVLTVPTVDSDFQGLIVSISGTSDRIYLRNQNSANGHGVERFEFADGTVLTDANLRTLLMSAIVTNGDDKVYGTNYADTINGGQGDDELTSGDGNDILTGGQGNDYLNGQGGDDTYVFNRGDGSDTIFDDWGTDTLRFGAGISAADLVLTVPTVDSDFQGLIVSIAGTSDRIYLRNQNSANGHGIERFEFADGTVLSDADLRTLLMSAIVGNGDDKVYGTNYADTINGGNGNDEITSGDGNDVLTGGKGNDYLNGQGNDDSYVYNRGDGSDTIFDDWGYDTLQFGEGIDESDVVVSRALTDSDGNGIILSIKGTDDRIYLRSEFDGNRIDLIKFQSGATWNVNTLLQLLRGTTIDGNTVPVTMGDDTIIGAATNDSIRGMKGDDLLRGGAGSDTYSFARGDGHDTIYDPTDVGSSDTLVLEGINPADVKVLVSPTDAQDLILYIDDDNVIYLDQQNASASSGIEQVRFADGTIWTRDMLAAKASGGQGTAGDDTLIGTNFADTLAGGAGNDTLMGSGGNDTYVYNIGDGDDTIIDDNGAGNDPSQAGNAGNVDTLSFGPGISLADIRLTQPTAGGPLVISFASHSGSITLKGLNTGGRSGVQLIRFADGSTVTMDQLRASAINAAATSGDDLIRGFGTDDTLDGGAGNDTLAGGGGADTYLFDLGDGADTIVETADGASNKLVFGAGIATADIHLLRTADAPDDLVLALSNGTDKVTIKSQFANGGAAGIQEIQFADGTVWLSKDFQTILLAQPATPGADYLVGDDNANSIDGLAGDDVIFGGAGDDTLYGSDGNDTLYGGAGDDKLYGGAGDDILSGDTGTDLLDGGAGFDIADYSFSLDNWSINLAAGTARIVISQNSTVSESLTAIEGVIGGLGSDTIVGDDGANQLQGGGGNDTLDGAGGDDAFIFDGDETGIDRIDGGVGYDRIEAVSDGTVIGLASLANVELITAQGHANVTIEATDDADTLDLSGAQLDGIASINMGGGNDVITGSLGADIINAGDGDDIIRYVGASTGGDQVDGGAGNDMIVAGADNSVIRLASFQNVEAISGNGFANVVLARTDASEVTDLNSIAVSGLAYVDLAGGDDTFVGTAQADTVRGGAGDDQLTGAGGDDVFQYAGTSSGFDTIDGGAGYDRLRAASDGAVIGIRSISNVEAIDGNGFANVRLVTTDGNDSLALQGVTLTGISEIDLGAGADSFAGSSGSDTVSGGLGNDSLSGGAGDDVYLFDRGDGNDVIREKDADGVGGGSDTLRFGANVSAADIQITRVNGGADYLLTIANGGGTVLIAGAGTSDTANQIENIQFADGTIWDLARIRLEAATRGSAIGERIDGTSGPDVIQGNGGDDFLLGWGGDDTYIYASGDGNDHIVDYNGGVADNDTLKLVDLNPGDVELRRSGDQLYIKDLTTGQEIWVEIQFHSSTAYAVENIQFADGTIWNLARIQQEAWYRGTAAAETIDGSAAADTLVGKQGDDLLRGGQGNDTYVYASGDGNDHIVDYNGGVADNDTLKLVDLNPGDVELRRSGDQLYIKDLTTGREIWIEIQFYSSGAYAVENIQFADGTIWNLARIQQEAWYRGTAAAETIDGSAAADTIVGKGGDDFLRGSQGNDTYVYASGDGNDHIVDYNGGVADNDTLKLVDLNPGDVELRRSGDQLYIKDLTTGQEIWIEIQFHSSTLYSVENIQFADGTVWDLSRITAVAATSGNDVLVGTAQKDWLHGLDGNDTLTGGGGNDLLDGGAGNDTAIFAGAMADYSVITTNGVITITDNQPTVDGDDGTDTLVGIETLQFKDGSISLAAPIVLDLNGDGVHLIDKAASNVRFDWNGDGNADKTGWVSRGDGLLAFDRNGDGTASGADELSFVNDVAGARSDLAGLAAFDSNGDGQLSAADDGWSRFGVWSDANGDGKVDSGEFLTMAQAGVASLDLKGTPTAEKYELGDNLVVNTGSFTRADGSTGAFDDVAFAYGGPDSATTNQPSGVAAALANAERFIQASATFGVLTGVDLIAHNDVSETNPLQRWEYAGTSRGI